MLTNAVFGMFHMQSCPSVNDGSTPTGSTQWKEEGSVFKVCILDHLLPNRHEVIIRSTQSWPYSDLGNWQLEARPENLHVKNAHR